MRMTVNTGLDWMKQETAQLAIKEVHCPKQLRLMNAVDNS